MPATCTNSESNIPAKTMKDEADVTTTRKKVPGCVGDENKMDTPELMIDAREQGVGAATPLSRSTKAVSADMASREGDANAESVRRLSHQVEVLTKTVKRMSNARPAFTHDQGTKKISIPD